jgi:hypothetical protein
MKVASLPERMKPELTWKKWAQAHVRPSGVRGDSACEEIWSGTRETPLRAGEIEFSARPATEGGKQ